MNKTPVNYLLTIAIGAILWIVFAILLASFFTENPNLAEKDPAELAAELRIIFACAVLSGIISSCFWYYYGDQEKVAGNLGAAKRTWNMLFILQIILSVALITVIIVRNMTEGIEANWYIIYFGAMAILTFIFFWFTTFLMSPRTVKFIPLGK